MSIETYANRQAAGKQLAEALQSYANRIDTIVLALPRGGVPVAFEVAKILRLPLDVFIVRKLGAPNQVELAMGAIAMGGTQVLNEDVIKELHISTDFIASIVQQEQEELARREKIYRGKRPPFNIKNKVVILVDDGIATGATIHAAIKALRQLGPTSIVVAVPVASALICERMLLIADKVICPLKLNYFSAVGAYYDEFAQTTDDEVITLLASAKH